MRGPSSPQAISRRSGTLTASKIEGDFPMDIPDDLEVNTVTASGTVKALNGEFDTVTVKDKNIILNQEANHL